jgi:hypothetical protein
MDVTVRWSAETLGVAENHRLYEGDVLRKQYSDVASVRMHRDYTHPYWKEVMPRVTIIQEDGSRTTGTGLPVQTTGETGTATHIRYDSSSQRLITRTFHHVLGVWTDAAKECTAFPTRNTQVKLLYEDPKTGDVFVKSFQSTDYLTARLPSGHTFSRGTPPSPLSHDESTPTASLTLRVKDDESAPPSEVTGVAYVTATEKGVERDYRLHFTDGSTETVYDILESTGSYAVVEKDSNLRRTKTITRLNCLGVQSESPPKQDRYGAVVITKRPATKRDTSYARVNCPSAETTHMTVQPDGTINRQPLS